MGKLTWSLSCGIAAYWQNGWGLTETYAGVGVPAAAAGRNVCGSVGLPMPGTQVRVVHPDTRADLPDGEQARTRAWLVGFRVLGFELRKWDTEVPCRARRSAWCTPTRAPTWPAASRRARRLVRVEGFAMM